MYQWVEGISLRRDMVELRQSTHKIRTDLAKTPDPWLEIHDPAFKSYALHYMYQSVDGISLRRDMVELRESTQKMRTNIAKTLDSELELHAPAFMSYALH